MTKHQGSTKHQAPSTREAPSSKFQVAVRETMSAGRGTPVIVNGRRFECVGGRLSYSAVVEMAGKGHGRLWTVTYAHRDASGSLERGAAVTVLPGMVFNVADTSGSGARGNSPFQEGAE